MVLRTSKIKVFPDGRISFKCTSELYGHTDAGGTAENALKMGIVPLGDGCDYILKEKDKRQIRKMIQNGNKNSD